MIHGYLNFVFLGVAALLAVTIILIKKWRQKKKQHLSEPTEMEQPF